MEIESKFLPSLRADLSAWQSILESRLCVLACASGSRLDLLKKLRLCLVLWFSLLLLDSRIAELESGLCESRKEDKT